VQLLFILRNPVERLHSHFNFAVGKLHVSERLPFADYVDLCIRYAAGELSAPAAGVAEKHLRALEIGVYAKHLRNYIGQFARESIKVVFFEHLKQDPARLMMEVCRFAGIAPAFFQDYAFNKVNVTFSARLKPLHFAALLVGRSLESVLRQRPRLKGRLVRLYKRLNQSREGYEPMSEEIRARLAAYYAPFNRELLALLPDQALPPWVEGSRNSGVS
jgi:hypothetical protein